MVAPRRRATSSIDVSVYPRSMKQTAAASRISAREPSGALSAAKDCMKRIFSVTLAKGGDLASVRSAAQTALKAQIKSINLTTDDSETPTLRISTVGNTIHSLLGVLDYANLRFNGQTANVEAGKEEVFVLGEVTVSETNPVS